MHQVLDLDFRLDILEMQQKQAEMKEWYCRQPIESHEISEGWILAEILDRQESFCGMESVERQDCWWRKRSWPV